MALKRNAGGLVPVTDASGNIRWQDWTYGELTQHLTNDLQLDASSDILGGSLSQALQQQGFLLPEGGFRSGAFAFAASTWTALPIDTSFGYQSANASHLDLASGGYRVPAAGLYLVMGEVLVSTNAANQYAYIVTAINGTLNGLRGSLAFAAGATGVGPTPYVASVIRAKANDLLQVTFWNNIANSLAISSLDNWVQVVRVG